MELIQLTRTNISKELFDDVVFMLYAYSGAMVEGGAVRFVTRSGKCCRFNYLRDDLDLDDIIPYFPVLTQCHFTVFGKGSTVPEGWHYMYVGTGNHLIFAESVRERFEALIKDYKYVNEIYRDFYTLTYRAVTGE